MSHTEHAEMEESGGGYWLDRSSSTPYYQQIKEKLIDQIADRQWKEGVQLPGEDELIKLFGVSRTVIRQALGEMVNEGLIYRQRGRGTFVARPAATRAPQLTSLEALVQACCGEPGRPRLLSQGLAPAQPLVSELLRIEPMAAVIKLIRLWELGKGSAFLLTDYLPYEPFRKLVDYDFERGFVSEALRNEVGMELDEGNCHIWATGATAFEASLLKTRTNAPVLKLHAIGYAGRAGPVIFSHGLLSGGEFAVKVMLTGLSRRESAA